MSYWMCLVSIQMRLSWMMSMRQKLWVTLLRVLLRGFQVVERKLAWIFICMMIWKIKNIVLLNLRCFGLRGMWFEKCRLWLKIRKLSRKSKYMWSKRRREIWNETQVSFPFLASQLRKFLSLKNSHKKLQSWQKSI